MQLSFDKSASEFVLGAFNFTVNKDGTIWKDNASAQCCYCLDHITVDNIAGILKNRGYLEGPLLMCNNTECLRKFADEHI